MADRAQQLRTHRQAFELACREGLSLADAKLRLARDRWAAADARRPARCGTLAPDEPEDADPAYWWQRGGMA